MNGLTVPISFVSIRVKLREIQKMELEIKCEIWLRVIKNQFAVCEKSENLWFSGETKV